MYVCISWAFFFKLLKFFFINIQSSKHKKVFAFLNYDMTSYISLNRCFVFFLFSLISRYWMWTFSNVAVIIIFLLIICIFIAFWLHVPFVYFITHKKTKYRCNKYNATKTRNQEAEKNENFLFFFFILLFAWFEMTKAGKY
jgi:hypothetical protein